MTNENFYAVIMAGGVGSRFWPMSKKRHPKQFIDILGKNKSLFQTTYERFKSICPEENIFVVANEIYADTIKKQVPSITNHQILKEPVSRNTAPCIAYAAQRINKINTNAVMVVAPSDHLILNEDVFRESITKALNFAMQEDLLVTLGIKPTRPDTGYGYIQMNDDHQREGFFKVKTFTEKPNSELAEHFFDSGEFLWNAGIFVWSVKSINKAIEDFLPEVHKSFESGLDQLNTESEDEFIGSVYSSLPNVSIDYGIMEKASNVYVLPADFAWSDIGTWNALYEFLQKDEFQNAIRGKQVFVRNSENCIVNVNDNKLVALNSVKDLIIVEADNILLIADKNHEQEIRQVVNEIKAQFGEKYI